MRDGRASASLFRRDLDLKSCVKGLTEADPALQQEWDRNGGGSQSKSSQHMYRENNE